MKTISRLKINPEKLMDDNELVSLRGGYDNAYCACKKDGSTLCSEWVENCGVNYGSCQQWCMYYCTDFEYAICAG